VKDTTANETPQKPKRKGKSGIFLNSVLVLLLILVVYLSYNLISKIIPSKEEANLQAKQKTADYIQIEVLNGCGVTGVADKFTAYLRSNKFDVIQAGNYSSFEVDKSMVIDRIGNMANAEKAAAMLGIKKEYIIQQINKNYFLDVTFVIGKDYNQLKPFIK
jgi:hypothetical protein